MAEWLKRAEIPAALVAGLGFITGWIPVLFVALAMYGCIAALFGPIKYGILPEHLDDKGNPGRQRASRKRHLRRHSARHDRGRLRRGP